MNSLWKLYWSCKDLQNFSFDQCYSICSFLDIVNFCLQITAELSKKRRTVQWEILILQKNDLYTTCDNMSNFCFPLHMLFYNCCFHYWTFSKIYILTTEFNIFEFLKTLWKIIFIIAKSELGFKSGNVYQEKQKAITTLAKYMFYGII